MAVSRRVAIMHSSKFSMNKKGKGWVYLKKSTKNKEPAKEKTQNDDGGKASKNSSKPFKKRNKRNRKKKRNSDQSGEKAMIVPSVTGQTKTESTTEELSNTKPEGKATNDGVKQSNSSCKPSKKRNKKEKKHQNQLKESQISSQIKSETATEKLSNSKDKSNGTCPSVSQSESQSVVIDAKTRKQKKKKEKRKMKILKRKQKEAEKKGLITSAQSVDRNTDGQGPQGLSEKVKRKIKGVKGTKGSLGVAGGKGTKDSLGVAGGKGTTDQSGGEGGLTPGEHDNRDPDSIQSGKVTTDKAAKRQQKAKAKKRKLEVEGGNTDTKQQDAAKRSKKDLDSRMSSGANTPILPTEPQDVAANWKALFSKLKPSSGKPSKAKKKDTDSGESKKDEIWFDDVDPALLETEKMSSGAGGGGEKSRASEEGETEDVKSNQITKCVALDCEMVGIGYEGKDSILARVSMVNEYGQCIYDKFVKPREKVTDYRTAVSGVRPSDLFRGSAEEFLTVQKEVAAIMKDRMLVGHALKNDMKVLFLGHPRKLVRDTATYPPFREIMKTKRPALRKLAKTMLGVTIQEGEHSSVVDARTAMRLYTLHRTAWEKAAKTKIKKASI